MGSTRVRVFWSTAIAVACVFAMTASGALGDESPSTLPNEFTTGPSYPPEAYRTDPPANMRTEEQGEDACPGPVDFLKSGWGLAEPSDGAFHPRRLEGEVVLGHPPHGDAVFNHKTEDYNFFVVPDSQDPLASESDADYRYLFGFGNFHAGEPKEKGRIEVEWEYGAHTWNDAADNGYYGGLPTWAWPNIGDRVITEGYWIFDCGHSPFRSEIHPAWFTATIRNMAQDEMARGANRHGWVAPLGPDDADFSAVTKVDVFISSFGGEAVDNIFDDDDFYGPDRNPPEPDWWQPVNSKDYDFNIPAPPKPSPDAQLKMQIQDPPAGPWIRPPGAVSPFFRPDHMTPFERGGRTFVHVHIPFSTVPDATYLLFAKTLIVGWDVPKPDVMHLRVNVKRWNVYDDLDSTKPGADYSAWVQSGDQNLWLPISDGGDDDEKDEFDCDSDENYMPNCDVEEENNFVKDGTFDRYIGTDDPLIIQFRAKDSDLPLENEEFGIAMQAFTAGDNWGLAQDGGIGLHFLRQSDFTFAGVYHDFATQPSDENPCDGEAPDDRDECYEVTYTIERIFESTSIAIGTPPGPDPDVQFAQDPNRFTAKVVTPGSPDKPRRHLPVKLTLSDGTNTQVLNGVTGDDGIAAPTDLLTVPAGTYQLTASFAGNGLLTRSSTMQTVTIHRDYTSTALEVASNKLRWGHEDPMAVALLEPNAGQTGQTPNEPIFGKNLTITLTGPLGMRSYAVGPTGSDGKATITPLMDLPPGNYMATACFAQDAWYRASCSTPVTIKITLGFSGFARGGPINFSGGGNTATGDLHSEGGVLISGNSHVLSAGKGERFEYVTTFSDIGTGNSYNEFQVSPLGIAPNYLRSTYCTGASAFMGVPVTYVTGTLTFKNDAVASGIYCVVGDIKIQSRVTGKAMFLATGLVTTSGSHQTLETADPTGADVLVLSESANSKAVSIQSHESLFKGALVATGGVYISSNTSTFDTGLVGKQVLVSGNTNLLKAPA
jgi:hypothetical protein